MVRSPKPRTALVRLAQATAGLTLGLALAEGAFWARDRGAFPHVNMYVPDAALGVRLEPGASEKVSFGGNPVTRVRVNREGYRGADWPAPSPEEIVVVGDSQAFGLGVEEGETFSAELSRRLGVPVLDAGVPTYGPPEYARVLDEILERRRPKAVVYTVNLANDLFEARRPNTERHAVWDGWAVRRETAPERVVDFPLRRALFGRSHAVFALRKYLFDRSGAPTRLGLPSEGDARDVVDAALAFDAGKRAAGRETERRGKMREVEQRFATQRAVSAEETVKLVAFKQLGLKGAASYLAAGASPGDIVVPQRGEDFGPLSASVQYIREAAELKARIERQLRDKAQASPEAPGSREVLRTLEERDALEQRLRELHAAPVELVRASMPLVGVIDEARAKVEAKGARFVLLVLPLDVHVSRDEWAKYGEPPVDTAPVQALADELVSAARDAGASALDATAALRAAEPGAFLNADLHMTPKGHTAVGVALAEALSAPAPRPPPRPRLALEPGRSRAPRPGEWPLVGELQVGGSTAAGCSTKRIREWMWVSCPARKGGPEPLSVRVLEGGHDEALALSLPGRTMLVAPVVRGDTLVARFSWAGQAKRLAVRWPLAAAEGEAAFEKDDGPPEPPHDRPAAEALCRCHMETSRAPTCDDLVASPDPDCMRTYQGDCRALLECASGYPLRMPRCPEGTVNAGAHLHCLPEGKLPLLGAPAAALPASSAAAPSPPGTATDEQVAGAGKPLVEAALSLGAQCKLLADAPGGWFRWVIYDDCSWAPEAVSGYLERSKALEALSPSSAEGADLVETARLFRGWVEHTQRTGKTRGTLYLLQDLTRAWNAFRPPESVPVDPPEAVRQYTEHMPEPMVHYTSASYGSYKARKARGLPLPWQHSFQGPYLPDE